MRPSRWTTPSPASWVGPVLSRGRHLHRHRDLTGARRCGARCHGSELEPCPSSPPTTTTPIRSNPTPPGASPTTSTPMTRRPTAGSSPGSASGPTKGRWTSACRCGSRAGSWPSTGTRSSNGRWWDRPWWWAASAMSWWRRGRPGASWPTSRPGRAPATLRKRAPTRSTCRWTPGSTPSPRPWGPTGSRPVARAAIRRRRPRARPARVTSNRPAGGRGP
jgi:hypothetical protein